MTLEELQKSWKDYALVQMKNSTTVPLNDVFMLCAGPMRGGLLFDTGGAQGAPAYVLKVDKNDDCWAKTDWQAPDDSGWELIGKLVKLSDLDD